ncbi:MAG TPA: hypothetical protein VFW73_02500 [Lacipirellulaceae bacterium]|nr:hypothetical protein [Lacipirellulaceae bacterium]
MKRKWKSWIAVALTSVGISLTSLGILAIPTVTQADNLPYCNEGADPSMPIGCFGWCYSPKICTIHPVLLVCKCR